LLFKHCLQVLKVMNDGLYMFPRLSKTFFFVFHLVFFEVFSLGHLGSLPRIALAETWCGFLLYMFFPCETFFFSP
jgi:hypothetical protein